MAIKKIDSTKKPDSKMVRVYEPTYSLLKQLAQLEKRDTTNFINIELEKAVNRKVAE